MEKKIWVFLAEGFEEVEAVTPVDYLRRAGIEAVMVSLTKNKQVTGSHGISIIADTIIREIDPDTADGLVLPGGMPGASYLAASPELDRIIRQYDAQAKLICAICASPSLVLGSKGILNGRSFTCYPGNEARVCCGEGCATWVSDNVVVDGHIITSRSAGTAGLFAKKIIEKLIDKPAADTIAQTLLLPA